MSKTRFKSLSKPNSSNDINLCPKDDIDTVPGQNYWVLTYVMPEGNPKIKSISNCLIKCSGCFETVEEACEHAKRVRNRCNILDVHVADMYKLFSIPPTEQEKMFIPREYDDPRLNKIMKGCYDSQETERREMERRKRVDREKALRHMRKVKGPDYEFKNVPETVKEYEDHSADHLKFDEDEEPKFDKNELTQAVLQYLGKRHEDETDTTSKEKKIMDDAKEFIDIIANEQIKKKKSDYEEKLRLENDLREKNGLPLIENIFDKKK